jgi:putative ABC transport system ATP-binding protein
MMISLRHLTKRYETPAGEFSALSDINLEIAAGELVAVVGKSGSGKSTLLNMLGGIDRPSEGSVSVDGSDLEGLSGSRLAVWRGRTVGFVFQSFQLLPTLTVVENVMLPMDFLGAVPARQRRQRAVELLLRVEVSEQADKVPAALSGGQQQRVAIARALANDPPLILADEPTGNLDSTTSAAIFALFGALVKAGKTVVVVTHDSQAFGASGRTVAIADGRLA